MFGRIFFYFVMCTLVLARQTFATPSLAKQAIEANNIVALKQLLTQGNVISNLLNNSDEALLHYAAELGNRPAVEMLIAHAADVTLSDSRGNKPLTYAIDSGKEDPQHAAVAAILLQAEFVAGGNRKDDNQWTPMHWAVWSRNRSLMQRLINEGESIWENSGGQSPVELAMSIQDVGLPEFLIKADGGINTADPINGGTPLSTAAGNGNLELVKLLLKCGARVNALNRDENFYSPLVAAIGNLPIVKLLLKQGVDVNAVIGSRDMTALQLAVTLGSKEIVEVLLQYGADVNAIDKDHQTALMKVVYRSNRDQGALDIIELLIDRKANINITDIDGNSALMLAAKVGFVTAIDLLLQSGADIHVQNNRGHTPIALATMAYNIKSVRLLQQYGANTDGILDTLTRGTSPTMQEAFRRVLDEAGG